MSRTSPHVSRCSTALRTAVMSVVALVTLGGFAAGTASAAESSTGAPVTVSTGAPNTGSVTATLTSPTAISGTRANANVPCTIAGRTYSISENRVTVNGYKVTAAMVIRNYTGPGTYSATVTMSISGPKYVGVGAVPNVKVTINATGGAWSFTKTATGHTYPKLAGTTIAGSIAWTCNH